MTKKAAAFAGTGLALGAGALSVAVVDVAWDLEGGRFSHAQFHVTTIEYSPPSG
jgi:hypothetical protein